MKCEKLADRFVAYAGMRESEAKEGLKGAFNSARVHTYGGVELLYIAHECACLSEKTDEILAAIRDSGIGVKCISCFADIVKRSGEYAPSKEAIAAVKSCIDLAAHVGCKYVHHTLLTRLGGGNADYSEALPVALQAAQEIACYAKERDVTILYEPQGMLFNGLDGYSGFFDEMLKRHDNVGVCLDVGNTLWVDEDCYALAEKYAHHVKHVHLKDYILDGNDERYRTMSGRTIKEVALGRGIIDLNRVAAILKAADYCGCYSIEDNSGSDFKTTAENAAKILADIFV